MKTYTTQNVKDFLLKVCRICCENQEYFTEADSRLGDGDMGSSIAKGTTAVEMYLTQKAGDKEDLTVIFMGCGMEFNRAAPSTLGTLISFGLIAIGKKMAHKKEIEENEIAELVRTFADTIAFRGKAKQGDKTILDALYPYIETFENSLKKLDLSGALNRAAEAAREGMESTKGIKAKTGRAKWLDSRNMEYPDAGAVLCVTIAEGIL